MIRLMKVLYGAVRYGTAGRIDEKVRKQQNSKLPAVPYCKVKHHAVQSVKEEAAEARSEQSRAEATANTKQASRELETNPTQQRPRHRLQARRCNPTHDAAFQGMIGRHGSVSSLLKSYFYLSCWS